MLPHLRVAWWDVKRTLAMRGRRLAVAVAVTALAGSGLAASQYSSNAPRPDDVTGHDQPGPASEPAFVSPTLPWPGTNP